MLSGILSPAFLQAAGRAGKGEPVGKIILDTQFADPTISSISCTGDIKVTTIKNGAPLVETYTDLDGETLSIQADANTQIIISGAEITACEIGEDVNYTRISVKSTALATLNCNGCFALTALDVSKDTALTELNCGDCPALATLDVSKNTALAQLSCSSCSALTTLDVSKNTALATLDCSSCSALTALDVSKNTALAQLNCSDCDALTALDVSKNTALAQLSCYDCSALTALDVSKNTALAQLDCGDCPALATLDVSKNTALAQLSCSNCKKLVSISYLATNSDVSTAVAGAITAATAADGTVYTDNAGAYYSTIETAANNKGWTIEQIA